MYETLKSWCYKLFGSSEPKPVKKPRKMLTPDEVKEIEECLIDYPGKPTYTQVELAIKYGVSTSVISKIYNGTHRYSMSKYGDDSEEHADA